MKKKKYHEPETAYTLPSWSPTSVYVYEGDLYGLTNDETDPPVGRILECIKSLQDRIEVLEDQLGIKP